MGRDRDRERGLGGKPREKQTSVTETDLRKREAIFQTRSAEEKKEDRRREGGRNSSTGNNIVKMKDFLAQPAAGPVSESPRKPKEESPTSLPPTQG